MITDAEANVVYISEMLESQYRELVGRLRGILSEHGIPVKVIRGTADFWVRDFMPVQLGPREFVRFRYTPDYLRDHKHLITDFDQLEPIAEIERCQDSDVILDGGNVVGWGNRCIVTHKIFRENPGFGRSQLLRMLRDLLRVEELIVIPREPYDVVGHADGVVRFLDEGTVVINDYSKLDPSYGKRLKSALRRARLSWAEVPYKPKGGRRGELPPAFGNYVNYLRVSRVVVLPAYGIAEDDEARRIIEQGLPDTAVIQVDCSALSMKAGVLNCVTWSVLDQRGTTNYFGAASCLTYTKCANDSGIIERGNSTVWTRSSIGPLAKGCGRRSL